ncbi:hypothetical protein YGS_C1P2556 [Sphingobium sp. YG1]|nr:hypothetical protein YGS_C1P2556 [Sphingobium sp. YG1]
MTALPGAIVLGLENAIGLAVVRDLGRHGVPVHGIARDCASIVIASRYCTDWTQRPTGPIADWLPGLIARTGARAVLAISETDLLQLSTLPAMIGDCHILVPRAAAARTGAGQDADFAGGDGGGPARATDLAAAR